MKNPTPLLGPTPVNKMGTVMVLIAMTNLRPMPDYVEIDHKEKLPSHSNNG